MPQMIKDSNVKMVILIGFASVLFMLFSALSYKIKPEHEHTAPQEFQLIESVGGESLPLSPEEERGTANNMPELGNNTQLPENIPSAMLDAMKERGLTVEDLQSGNMQGNNNSTSQFPPAMLEAMEAQNKNKLENNIILPEGISYPSEMIKAINHMSSHSELRTDLQNRLNIIGKNSLDVVSRQELAAIFIAHNEANGALYLLQEAMTAEPSNAKTVYLSGLAYNQMGNPKQAAKEWERALSLENHAQMRYELAMLYRYRLDKDELAILHFNEALKAVGLTDELKMGIEKELK